MKEKTSDFRNAINACLHNLGCAKECIKGIITNDLWSDKNINDFISYADAIVTLMHKIDGIKR
jgi:hypothetical protein